MRRQVLALSSVIGLSAIGLGTPSSASATTGLSWQWPAEPRRFLLGVYVELPQFLTVSAERNIELRTTQYEVDLVTSCAPVEPAPKKGFRVECTIEDIAWLAKPSMVKEQDHIEPVLAEIDVNTTGAKVQLLFDALGHIKSYDLEGMTAGTPREREQYALVRLLLMRAFALLDFSLPKAGDDRGMPWRVTNSLVHGYPSELGVTGSFPLDTVVTSTDGSLVTLKQEAAGIVNSGDTGGPANLPFYTWDMKMSGEATFDVASGRLMKRQYSVVGVTTGSSQSGTAVAPYRQIATLGALGASEHPELRPSGAMAE